MRRTTLHMDDSVKCIDLFSGVATCRDNKGKTIEEAVVALARGGAMQNEGLPREEEGMVHRRRDSRVVNAHGLSTEAQK